MSRDHGTISLYGEPLGAGALVGPYLVDEVVGRGGGGTVYRARDVHSGRPAALKVLHREWLGVPTMVQRFAREARALAHIDHPGVVGIHEVGTLHDGRPYCAMEWLEGPDLARELATRGPLSPAELAEVAIQIGGALAAVHERGLVHRDLKPANVIAVGSSVAIRYVLVDFGIARWAEADPGAAISSGSTLGTPAAMAPEQIRGEPATARTDVYGFGVFLHQLLTGRAPFSGDLAELEDQHLHAPPPRTSELAPVSPEVDAVIGRCLAKRPDDRYTSMDELVAELAPALLGVTPAAAACVGVFVEAVADDPDVGDELLELAAEVLERGGLTVAVETGDALLAVGRDATDETRRRAVDCALALAGPGLVIRVHAAEAVARGGRYRGGALFELDAWPRAAGPGLVTLSPQAAPHPPPADPRLRRS